MDLQSLAGEPPPIYSAHYSLTDDPHQEPFVQRRSGMSNHRRHAFSIPYHPGRRAKTTRNAYNDPPSKTTNDASRDVLVRQSVLTEVEYTCMHNLRMGNEVVGKK